MGYVTIYGERALECAEAMHHYGQLVNPDGSVRVRLDCSYGVISGQCPGCCYVKIDWHLGSEGIEIEPGFFVNQVVTDEEGFEIERMDEIPDHDGKVFDRKQGEFVHPSELS